MNLSILGGFQQYTLNMATVKMYTKFGLIGAETYVIENSAGEKENKTN